MERRPCLVRVEGSPAIRAAALPQDAASACRREWRVCLQGFITSETECRGCEVQRLELLGYAVELLLIRALPLVERVERHNSLAAQHVEAKGVVRNVSGKVSI